MIILLSILSDQQSSVGERHIEGHHTAHRDASSSLKDVQISS